MLPEDAYSVVAEDVTDRQGNGSKCRRGVFCGGGYIRSVEEINASVKEVESNAKESARLASDTRAILGGQCMMGFRRH